MNYVRIRKLPTPQDIIQHYPLSENAHEKIMRHRSEIKHILTGRDNRLLVIVGPCSAWPKEAVLEYANRLAILNTRVEKSLKLIMRMYIQKPRTTKGWVGPLIQPDPYQQPNIEEGMRYARSMMVQVVEMGLPIADECLFTHNAKGFSELVSWFAIGARSSEDHEHRIFASGANCPVGMKNPTHGSLEIAINSVVAAQHAHVAAIDQYEVHTKGNHYAHLILRGGNKKPNYSLAHLEEVQQLLLAKKVINPAVIIDASHDNCIVNGVKDHLAQSVVINHVMQYLMDRPDLRKIMRGFMIESYLKNGNQQIELCDAATINRQGLSITDPCLGFDETESLLLSLAQKITL